MICLTKKPDLEQCTQQLPEMVIQWQIKKLTVVKSQEEFEREVNKLGKLRHANLVQLKGYYWTTSLQLLIYGLLCGGSLYKHLHEAPEGVVIRFHGANGYRLLDSSGEPIEPVTERAKQ